MAQVDHKNGFCSHYEYSQACYDHWDKVSEKVDRFVATMITQIQAQPVSLGYARLTALDDQLQEAVAMYAGTHWQSLILHLREQFAPYLLQMEEEILTISVSAQTVQWVWDISATKDEFLVLMRRTMLRGLIEQWFDGFINLPYKDLDTSWLISADLATSSVYVSSPVYEWDALDLWLMSQYPWFDLQARDVVLSPSTYGTRKWQVHLFKTTEDLEALWYELVSHRTRINKDEGYRRTNIATSFDQIGHVRVLNPGDELSFLEDSNFDPYNKQLYQNGFVIFLDEEKEDYGGGLCGWSTAIYQWIVTNAWLSRPKLRNHSKWYHHLYDAQIDGQAIATPGIDSTIYSSSLDLRLRNETDHPMVLVLNYEWGYDEQEEVFTIWYSTDRGSLTYKWSRPYYTSLNTKNWAKKVTWQCHTWDINGEERESCYKEVKK